VIICNIIVIPRIKPRFQKEFIWRGQGYDCKWDFISNTKYNSCLKRKRKEKLQLQKKIQETKSPTQRWKKCNTVTKKKTQILTESLIDKHMIRNSFICKLINVQANMKENKEKKIKNCDEISKLIKAFPKDIAALDKRSVLAKVNSQGSGR